MLNKLILLSLPMLLAACGASSQQARPEEIVVPQQVLIPTPQPCVPPSVGGVPTYLDNDAALLAAVGADGRYQLLIAGREQRISRLKILESVVDACPKFP